MMPTQKAFDTFEFAHNIDLSKYSAILACGGDGTYYEVANGMLARSDGLTVPLGIVPNGSGNTVGYLLGIENVDEAIDTVIAATACKLDTTRVLADVEKNEDIPIGKAGYEKRRYALCGLFGGWMPEMVQSAIPLKPYFGSAAYSFYYIKLLIFGRSKFQYDAEVDGKLWPRKEGKDYSFNTDIF